MAHSSRIVSNRSGGHAAPPPPPKKIRKIGAFASPLSLFIIIRLQAGDERNKPQGLNMCFVVVDDTATLLEL